MSLVLKKYCPSRSCPRPQRALSGRAIPQQVPEMSRYGMLKPPKVGQSRPNGHYIGSEPLTDYDRPDSANGSTNHISRGTLGSAKRNSIPLIESYVEPIGREFSDATSSDWSLFTSSDEASFTTESTRDSFSTVDYADTNVDPISSIFNTIYVPECSRNSFSCRKFSNNRAQTRFFSQEKGKILNSYLSAQPPLDRTPRGEYMQLVGGSPTVFSSDNNPPSMFVRYGSNPVQWD